MSKLPAGKYIIIDPFKAMKKEVAESVLFDYFNNEKHKDTIVVFEAMYGSGLYSSNQSVNFDIKSGFISVLNFYMSDPLIVAEAIANGNGLIKDFDADFECSYENGMLLVGDLLIETNWAYEFFID